jgi:hypothetical protein
MPVHIDDRAGLAAEDRAELGRALAPLATLEHVVRWGLGATPARPISAVIVQDEFTHDVVMPWRPGAWLVFATT